MPQKQAKDKSLVIWFRLV